MSLNLGISFLAGLATFFSPCILPIIPGYLAILSSRRKERLLRRVLIFVAGLATAFIILGLLVGWLGMTLSPLRSELTTILGIVLIVLGLNLIWPLPIPFLQGDYQARVAGAGSSDVSAFLLGGAFGVAWTPCTGLILGAILTQALVLQAAAVPLLIAYAVGIIAPMVGLAILFERTGRVIKLPSWFGRYYAPILGILIIIFGVALLTGWLDSLRSWLFTVTPTSGLCVPITH